MSKTLKKAAAKAIKRIKQLPKMEFIIQTNVPLPKYSKSKMATLDYPLEKLKVGESFVTEEAYSKEASNRVRSRIKLMVGRKAIPEEVVFSVARDPSEDKKSPSFNKVRVWRTQ